MKKLLLTFISLFLVFTLCGCELVAVNPINKGGQSTEAVTDANGVTYKNATRADYNGIWHSYEMASAFEITNDGVKLYELTYGYYEYENTVTLTAAMNGKYLVVSIDGSSLSLGLTAENELVTVDYGYALTKMEELPVKHVLPAFPDLTAYADVLTVNKTDFESNLRDALDDYRLTSLLNLWLQYNSQAEELPVKAEGTVQFGDYVNIDYSGKLVGATEPFAGGTTAGADILICKQSGYIPGFVEGLIGHDLGETFDVTVTFPENYGSTDLAGKQAVFTMKINKIYDTTVTAEMLGDGYTTVDEWVKKTTLENAEDIFYGAMTASAVYTEIPEACYAYFKAYFSDEIRYYAWSYGLDYETYVTYGLYQGYDYSDTGLTNNAIAQAVQALSVYATARTLNITFTQEQLDAKTESVIQGYVAEGENEADVRDYYENQLSDVQRNYFMFAELLLEKLASDYILE